MPENLLDFLSPEVISALIALLGSIITFISANLSAKHTAKNEIKKLKLEWSREDRAAENQLFSDMSAAISKYIQSGWSRHQRDALSQIAILQTNCNEDYCKVLEDLQKAVLANDVTKTVAALTAVNRLRRTAVKSKRE